MDLSKIIKSISSLNEYILTSQDASTKYKGSKVQFNMSTVLALKKIRSYEIEHFNKCEENGFACIVFELILNLPSSKTWSMLGKELVNLLQYWLEAIRKHLISHSINWWTFLKRLLKFLKDISQKDTCLPNLLVEQTAECLLDLGSNDQADPFQKLEILQCLNSYCAESSREIRFAMRNKFGDYFVKLSSFMVSCGYLPCQFVVVETLMRWLVPRQDSALRAAAAGKWFQHAACPPPAINLFLTRPWLNFHKDARDFLNAINEPNDLITSVICRKLVIGAVVVISGSEKQETWLDINTTGRCLSILLDPSVMRQFNTSVPRVADTLLLTYENTLISSLHRESDQLTISVSTASPPEGLTAAFTIMGNANRHVKITISSNSDVKRLDNALRNVFDDKYQLLMDLDNMSLSPLDTSLSFKRNGQSSEEDTRFSHPAQVKRRRHSGYIVRSKQLPWNSPSTASTSSLAFLHEKLAALPRYEFNKEPASVCVKPALSSVTEVSETDDIYSHNSAITSKYKPYGVCYRNIQIKETRNRNCQSDGEVKHKPKDRQLSPTICGKNSASCLLVATIGSADESVINDTIERLSKSKDYNSDNIVDLLVQEALHNIEVDQRDTLPDSDINTGDIKKNRHIQEDSSEAIENTPFADEAIIVPRKNVINQKNCTIISKSPSTEESNAEVVNESHVNYVNDGARRKNLRLRKIKNKEHLKNTDFRKPTIELSEVEYFFNQNQTENPVENVVTSPTLAKKINESSSETSEDFEENYTTINENTIKNPVKDIDDIEIIGCLNSMVDEICNEIEKCSDNLNRENDDISKLVDFDEVNIQKTLLNCEIREKLIKNKTTSKQKFPKQKKGIKLKFKGTIKREKVDKPQNKMKKSNKFTSGDDNIQRADIIHLSVLGTSQLNKSCVTKKIKNPESDPISKMSILLEADNAIIDIDDVIQKENVSQNIPIVISPEEKRDTKDICNKTVFDTPLMRRKRKLYSPKEDQPDFQTSGIEEDNITLSELKSTKNKTPKSVATCYKDLENERRKYIRKPCTRKTKCKILDSISPRTLKMDQVFEKLKENIENSEKIRTANKTSTGMDIYNFTSDSEDEDFKKKINLPKNTSTTTLESFKSSISTRHGRITNRVNYSDSKSSNDEKKSANTKRKRVVKKQKTNRKVGAKPLINLVDERMRQETAEVLNTSLVLEKSIQITNKEPELVLDNAPELEHIADDNLETNNIVEIKSKSDKKVKSLIQKKEKVACKKNSLKVDMIEDRTESPLPGLVVESVPTHSEDPNDSVTTNMLQIFKKIYQGSEACVNETNTTQNLLPDVDKVTYSPENINNTCYTEDIAQIEVLNLPNKTNKKTTKIRKPRMKLSRNTSNIHRTNTSNPKIEMISNDIEEITHIYDANDELSEKSIQTVNITAHGDIDELPPSLKMIEQKVQPRDLEIEDLNQSGRDYFSKLTAKLNEINRETSNSSDSMIFNIGNVGNNSSSDKKSSLSPIISRVSEEVVNFLPGNKDFSQKHTDEKKAKKVNISSDKKKSPVALVNRLSSDEMHKYLPSHNNSSSDQNSEKSNVYRTNIKTNDITNELKSPVVSVQQLSLSEIHKWLPSQNNSISDQKSEKSNLIYQINATKPDTTNVRKSPVVSVKRLSLSETHKRLPSSNNSIPDQNIYQINTKKHDTTKKVMSPVVSVKRLSLSEVHKWLQTRQKSSGDRESQRIPDKVVDKDIKTKKRNEHCDDPTNDSVNLSLSQRANKQDKLNHAFDKPKETRYTEISSHKADRRSRPQSILENSVEDEENNRKSVIFLIEIDGLIAYNENTREQCQSHDDDKIARNVCANIRTETNVTKFQDVNSSPKNQHVNRQSNNSRSGFEMDIESPTPKSIKIDSSRASRKRKSSTITEDKKQKTEVVPDYDAATIGESGPSISSVNDWFRRNELTQSKDDTIRLTLVDFIQNIAEKLDTTLDSINKNTSRNLVYLFVDAQKQLDKQKQERHELYRQTTSDILRDISKILDVKFADLDKRSQEMEADFMGQLRTHASKVILKDAQQKQAMVHIMKEDVQAVNYISQNKK